MSDPNRRELLNFFGIGAIITPLMAGPAPQARLIEVPKVELIEPRGIEIPLDPRRAKTITVTCHMDDGTQWSKKGRAHPRVFRDFKGYQDVTAHVDFTGRIFTNSHRRADLGGPFMMCPVCEREMRERTPEAHVLELSPMGELCTGCWMAEVQLELFLTRGGAHVGIGGYVKVREILKAALAQFYRDDEVEKA